MRAEATVVKNAGSHYLLSHLPEWNLFPAVLRGRVRLERSSSTNPVAVGDKVIYEAEGEVNEQNPAVIKEILPRSNYLIRKSTNLSRQSHVIAANLDQCVLVVTITNPSTSTTFIDRFLATAEAYNIPTTIVFNKIDLLNEDQLEYLKAMDYLYRSIGYNTLQISATQDIGINNLHQLLQNKITLLSGNSGVGKSTLINALNGNLNLETGEISDKLGRGRHTTRQAEIFEVGEGLVIDTAGFSSIDFTADNRIYSDELQHFFREFAEHIEECRFTGCSHLGDKGCRICELVAQGKISDSRHESYKAIFSEVKNNQKWNA